VKKQIECNADSLTQVEDRPYGVPSKGTPVSPSRLAHTSPSSNAGTTSACSGLILSDAPAAHDKHADVADSISWDPLLSSTAFQTPYGEVPTFYDAIMVPGSDFVGTEAAQLPPDFANLFPDQEWFDEMDLFGNDFLPTLDEALNVPPLPSPPATIQLDGTDKYSGAATQGLSRSEHARKRHAIFQRSPWLWQPQQHQNAFSEHSDIRLDDTSLHSASSPHQPL
jgi:hypothetical protein